MTLFNITATARLAVVLALVATVAAQGDYPCSTTSDCAAYAVSSSGNISANSKCVAGLFGILGCGREQSWSDSRCLRHRP